MNDPRFDAVHALVRDLMGLDEMDDDELRQTHNVLGAKGTIAVIESMAMAAPYACMKWGERVKHAFKVAATALLLLGLGPTVLLHTATVVIPSMTRVVLMASRGAFASSVYTESRGLIDLESTPASAIDYDEGTYANLMRMSNSTDQAAYLRRRLVDEPDLVHDSLDLSPGLAQTNLVRQLYHGMPMAERSTYLARVLYLNCRDYCHTPAQVRQVIDTIHHQAGTLAMVTFAPTLAMVALANVNPDLRTTLRKWQDGMTHVSATGIEVASSAALAVSVNPVSASVLMGSAFASVMDAVLPVDNNAIIVLAREAGIVDGDERGLLTEVVKFARIVTVPTAWAVERSRLNNPSSVIDAHLKALESEDSRHWLIRRSADMFSSPSDSTIQLREFSRMRRDANAADESRTRLRGTGVLEPPTRVARWIGETDTAQLDMMTGYATATIDWMRGLYSGETLASATATFTLSAASIEYNMMTHANEAVALKACIANFGYLRSFVAWMKEFCKEFAPTLAIIAAALSAATMQPREKKAIVGVIAEITASKLEIAKADTVSAVASSLHVATGPLDALDSVQNILADTHGVAISKLAEVEQQQPEAPQQQPEAPQQQLPIETDGPPHAQQMKTTKKKKKMKLDDDDVVVPPPFIVAANSLMTARDSVANTIFADLDPSPQPASSSSSSNATLSLLSLVFCMV